MSYIIVLTLTSYAVFATTCFTPKLSNEINNFNSLINSCDSKKEKRYTNIKSFCNCSVLQTNKENKNSTAKNKKAHNTFLAQQYQKRLKKAVFSISNDIDVLEATSLKSNSEKLFKSCNIKRQFSDEKGSPNASIIKSCSNNTFAQFLGGIKAISSELNSSFEENFKESSSPHRNTEKNNQCNSNSKKNRLYGFVKRCSDNTRATCNISDKMAQEIYYSKQISDLATFMSILKTQKVTTFSHGVSAYDQITESIFFDKINLEKRLSNLENLVKTPLFHNLLNNPNKQNTLRSILAKSSNLSHEDLKSLLKNEISQSQSKEIEKKCQSIFKEAINFFCQKDPSSEEPKLILPEEDFLDLVSKNEQSQKSIAMSQYYCSLKRGDGSKTDQKSINAIDQFLHSDEQGRRKDFTSLVNKSYIGFHSNIRGTPHDPEKPGLCEDIYGPTYEKAKKLGLKQENLTDPDDQVELYDFQLKEYSKLLSEQCPKGKISDKCSYLAELVNITEDKLDKAIKNQDLKKEDIKTAKENGTKYIARSYLVEQPSLAEAVLIGSSTGATKKVEPKKKKEDVAKKEDKSKVKESSREASSKESTFTTANSSISDTTEQNTASSLDNTSLSIGSSSTSQTGLSLSSSSPSQKYWSERSKRIDEDIKKAQKYLSTLTDDQKEERKERIEQIKFEKATETLTKALEPRDYIEEQNHINKHTLQDEGRVPASTKIANPVTHDLRNLENKILNETINRDLASDDRIELKKYTPGDAGLINKHKLVDTQGNVLDIMEVKIKGSIEEDFTKVLEEDEEKSITKDRKMILADPSQDAHFKNLAKALVKKETFLISRYDNEDIKLIIKYNNESKDYTVEPFADKERLSIYEEDYLEFQKNISNAIKDKTFKTLMRKYSKGVILPLE